MKRISLTEQDIQKTLEELATKLLSARNSDSWTYTFNANITTSLAEKIKMQFTALAWLKMRALVENCTTEIAWHGIVEASEDRKSFIITDILVYPQTVTGATVVTDETKYETWHQALDDDSYNKLRFQAHSHVNMSATPSSVDKALYDNMLQTLSTNSYYIFMITNKHATNWTSSVGMWINIYDLKNNVIYETSDITLSIAELDSNWYTQTVDAALQKPAPVTYLYSKPSKQEALETPYYMGYDYDDLYRDPYYATDNSADLAALRVKAAEQREKREKEKKEKNSRYPGNALTTPIEHNLRRRK